ncbi:GIY-YIG nuclease family protein [Epilithonimonas sp. UC225_85]|uniref:GIY-YIG nuclease family protein n=1 Tax=Epilithonimonas sp. UC225_85 TaxID=3350167 RepID=UPI0036D2CA2B
MVLFFIYGRICCLYIIFREFNKTYVGFTSSIIDRIKSHNFLATKGYTIKFRPWTVIHTEFFNNKKDAMEREKFLKSGQGRLFVKSLCQ